MDVTPTVLRLFGLDVPADLQGRVIEAVVPDGLASPERNATLTPSTLEWISPPRHGRSTMMTLTRHL